MIANAHKFTRDEVPLISPSQHFANNLFHFVVLTLIGGWMLAGLSAIIHGYASGWPALGYWESALIVLLVRVLRVCLTAYDPERAERTRRRQVARKATGQ